MRIGTPIPRKKARIEIIPLIDVMFFLLAAFMMVSLTMQRLRTLRLNLPTAVSASADSQPDILEVDLARNGDLRVDDRPVSLPELFRLVKERRESNPDLPVYLRPDPQSLHGHMIQALDIIHAAGATRVSFPIDPVQTSGT
jgi:biopolymer transport protein ExbD